MADERRVWDMKTPKTVFFYPNTSREKEELSGFTENTENIFVIAFFQKIYPRGETLVRIKNRRP